MELAAPGGYVRRWLDAGPGTGPLLRDLRDQSDIPQALRPYLDALLDACRTTFGHQALNDAGLAIALDPHQFPPVTVK